jgi:hypothetical protein
MDAAKQLTQRAGDFLQLWISWDQACREAARKGVPADLAKAVVRDAVQDDVPLRLTTPDGAYEDIAPEDRRRLMLDLEKGRAWLMGGLGTVTQPVSPSEPEPEWGSPFEVKWPALRDHLERLVPSQTGDQVQAPKGKRGRAPDDAKLPALMAAIMWLYPEGKPVPLTLLMQHMQAQLDAQGYRPVDERTIRTWADEFCQFWDDVLATAPGGRN